MVRSKAFTLIELLVVISIISLLISILLPSLAKARKSAQRAACLSSLHQIGPAFAMYTNDWRGHLPSVQNQSGTSATNPHYNYLWTQELTPYVGPNQGVPSSSNSVPKLFRSCPAWNAADRWGGDSHKNRTAYGMANTLLRPNPSGVSDAVSTFIRMCSCSRV